MQIYLNDIYKIGNHSSPWERVLWVILAGFFPLMGVLDFFFAFIIILILRKQNIQAMGWEIARGKSELVMIQELSSANKVKLENQAASQILSALKRVCIVLWKLNFFRWFNGCKDQHEHSQISFGIWGGKMNHD